MVFVLLPMPISRALSIALNCIEFYIVFSDVLLYSCGKVCFNLFRSPLAVKKELSAGLYIVYYLIVLEDIRRIVAGNEVCLGYIVRGLDRLITESEVRNGNAAGLLGVVLEVSLINLSVWSPMILMEFLLAPTVPSPPSPQNLQLIVPFGSCIGSGLFFERVVR